jgi:F-type H+-transporting ATPase subunit b
VQIDWLTVSAQLVNFLVLIWLLKRFLYGPITDAMARREKRIEDRLSDARHAREEAEAEAEALREKQRALEDSREAEMTKARAVAEALRAELAQELRAEAEQKRAAWLDHLKEERAEIVLAMQKRMAAHVREVVRRILADFADTDLADQIASEFALKLETLEEEDRQRLAMTAAKLHEPALIESGMELPPAARGRITRAVHEHIAADVEIDYQTAKDVLFGIRLTLSHQVLEWSAGRYLDRIETLVVETLDSAASEAADAA